MSSLFMPTPAGTPVQPSTQARYYQRRQVFSRNPITDTNFAAGRTVNFNFEVSGPHYAVLQESRIVAKLLVKQTADEKLSKSVRFATDPISNMFSSCMLSANGTTIESHAANVDDISRIQLRTESTKAGADGPGSAGLLSFNQTMTREEQSSSTLDFAAGGAESDPLLANAAEDATRAALTAGVFATTAPRSDKHELLLRNCSATSKAADGSATQSIEISTPLGQMFTFARQDKAFLPNMQFQVQLVISEHYAKNMCFSETLRGGASSAGVRVAFRAADTGGTPTQVITRNNPPMLP